jgi:anaerobic nitric oxide reductase transcription regulator
MPHNPAAEPVSLMPLRQSTDAYQRQLLRLALEQGGGSWAAAARLLDIDPSNLHKLARRLGLK